MPLGGGLEKTFLLKLITLAGRYGRLPASFAVVDKAEVSEKIFASGGFADVRTGVYGGRPVAVRTLRVLLWSDMNKVRNVRNPRVIGRDTE